MLNTEINPVTTVLAARRLAMICHQGQKRKYTGEPYFVHCEEVAGIIAAAHGDAEMICAAYLHDTIEDTVLPIDAINEKFGVRVGRLVLEVTNPSRQSDGNRAVRKAIDREHLAKASDDGQTIKLADIISNTKTVVQHDKKFAKIYLAEIAEILAVLTRGDSELYLRALHQLSEGQATLAQFAADKLAESARKRAGKLAETREQF